MRISNSQHGMSKVQVGMRYGEWFAQRQGAPPVRRATGGAHKGAGECPMSNLKAELKRMSPLQGFDFGRDTYVGRCPTLVYAGLSALMRIACLCPERAASSSVGQRPTYGAYKDFKPCKGDICFDSALSGQGNKRILSHTYHLIHITSYLLLTPSSFLLPPSYL